MRKLCYKITEAAFPIKLYQLGVDRFEVVYGKQVDTDLTYGDAATKLGEAIMHALACESKLNNSERRRIR